MTRTYNDVEAVTRLLEEKEKDLELAARIGQGLLQRNKLLEDRIQAVESELAQAQEIVTQLRHDLSLKSELLQIYTNDIDDTSPDGVRAFTFDTLQRKVKGLEDDNRKLRAEASQLVNDTSECEVREEKLLHDVLDQLNTSNQQLKQLDDELAKKSDETTRQKEEIASLLTQLVDQRHKIRQLTDENEDLTMHLQIVRQCQNELASELADSKQKYSEILELLRETQEQLKKYNKRQLPVARGLPSFNTSPGCNGSYTPAYNPDSLASELELSSLSSDSWNGESSTPRRPARNQFQRVFDTVRCVSQSSSSQMSFTTIPTSTGTDIKVSAEINTTHVTTITPTGDVPSKVNIVRTGAQPDYPGTSKIGVPGTPGTIDLTNALRRLTPNQDSSRGMSQSDVYGWRTPDSIMSTGSRSACSSISPNQCPEKLKVSWNELKIIKPMEGSSTLHHWSRLATPHLGTLLEERPGVATRDMKHEAVVKYTRELLEYTLSDVEEDEETSHPGKSFESAGTIYTFTNSTVLHPDDQTRVTSALQGSCISASIGYPLTSIHVSVSVENTVSSLSRRNSVTTFSTQMTLAKALHERGTDFKVETHFGWSGMSTPCNSPVWTPSGSPPSSYGPFEFLQKGAKFIRRTLTGEETPVYEVPRMTRAELKSLSNMNLLDKLEKLGLHNTSSTGLAVSPKTLQAALEALKTTTDDDDLTLSSENLTWSGVGQAPSLSDIGEIKIPGYGSSDSERSFAPGQRRPACSTQYGRPCTPGKSKVNLLQLGTVPSKTNPENGLNSVRQLDSPTYFGSIEIRAKFQSGSSFETRKDLGTVGFQTTTRLTQSDSSESGFIGTLSAILFGRKGGLV